MSDIIHRKSIGGDVIPLIDESDPRSVFHLLPEGMQNYVRDIPTNYWEMSFAELTREAKPDVDLKQLRIAFWMDYERAKRNGSNMQITNIIYGVMSRQRFNSSVVKKPSQLCFLLTPPEDYRVRLEEMLQLALEEERKILELPLTKKKISIDKDTGEAIVHETTDTSIASVKHKIRESLQNRIYGLPVARTHQVNINKNYQGTDVKPPEEMTDQELESLIQELKKREARPVLEAVGATECDGGARDGLDGE